MTDILIPYSPPETGLEEENDRFQKRIFLQNRENLLRALGCIGDFTESVRKLPQDQMYKFVFWPEGAHLYKDAEGNLQAVFYKNGKILQHGRLREVRPSMANAATALGAQVLLIGVAMQLNRIEKGNPLDQGPVSQRQNFRNRRWREHVRTSHGGFRSRDAKTAGRKRDSEPEHRRRKNRPLLENTDPGSPVGQDELLERLVGESSKKGGRNHRAGRGVLSFRPSGCQDPGAMLCGPERTQVGRQSPGTNPVELAVRQYRNGGEQGPPHSFCRRQAPRSLLVRFRPSKPAIVPKPAGLPQLCGPGIQAHRHRSPAGRIHGGES